MPPYFGCDGNERQDLPAVQSPGKPTRHHRIQSEPTHTYWGAHAEALPTQPPAVVPVPAEAHIVPAPSKTQPLPEPQLAPGFRGSQPTGAAESPALPSSTPDSTLDESMAAPPSADESPDPVSTETASVEPSGPASTTLTGTKSPEHPAATEDAVQGGYHQCVALPHTSACLQPPTRPAGHAVSFSPPPGPELGHGRAAASSGSVMTSIHDSSASLRTFVL